MEIGQVPKTYKSGVEPLGKPVVDGGKKLSGFGLFALPLPKATQAHGGAKLVTGVRRLVDGLHAQLQLTRSATPRRIAADVPISVS